VSAPPAAPRRGEVYWYDFAATTGRQMTGRHPCVIVQNDVGNLHSALTIIAAVTSNLRVAALPVGVLLPAGTAGLTRDSVVHCGHLYTVEKNGLGKRIGALPPDKLTEVEQALLCSLGLGTP
jgi:mRNA interferase MazF